MREPLGKKRNGPDCLESDSRTGNPILQGQEESTRTHVECRSDYTKTDKELMEPGTVEPDISWSSAQTGAVRAREL